MATEPSVDECCPCAIHDCDETLCHGETTGEGGGYHCKCCSPSVERLCDWPGHAAHARALAAAEAKGRREAFEEVLANKWDAHCEDCIVAATEWEAKIGVHLGEKIARYRIWLQERARDSGGGEEA